jgi:hypothetical protein
VSTAMNLCFREVLGSSEVAASEEGAVSMLLVSY